jgi:micrococcal nuclease
MTKNNYIFILLLITFLFISNLTGCSTYKQVKDFLQPDYIKCDVVKVVDGDTFDCQLSDVSIERVKLIGTGISESVRDSAKDFSKSYLRRGIPVRLEFDTRTRDSYGSALAYVYLAAGGEMLNALLIQEGYAQVVINPPNLKYKDMFMKLEAEAREQSKGMWKSK